MIATDLEESSSFGIKSLNTAKLAIIGAVYISISLSVEGGLKVVTSRYSLVQAAVIAPVAINVHTAVSERGDNRGNPQIPCPDVHPFANRVPDPTNKPPMITVLAGILVVLLSCGVTIEAMTPDATNPRIYVIFGALLDSLFNAPRIMPEIPVCSSAR